MLLLYNFQFHLATVEDIVELSIDSSREEVLQYLMLNYMLYVVFIGRRNASIWYSACLLFILLVLYIFILKF